MFYFKDAGIPPSKIDSEQLAKVQAFKHRISSEHGGLYNEFETPEEFQTKARIHLSKLVQAWLAIPDTMHEKKLSTNATPSHDVVDPLANLRALSNEDNDEEGVVELMEHANDSMMIVVGVVEKMTEAINEIGEKFELRTREVNELISSGMSNDVKSIKRVSNNAANDLEVFVNRMSVEIPEFYKQHTAAMDAFGKVAMISATDFNNSPDEIMMALTQIQTYQASLSSVTSSISEYKGVIASMPRMTAVFNRSRKRAAAILDDLLSQFRSAARLSEDVEKLLTGMSD